MWILRPAWLLTAAALFVTTAAAQSSPQAVSPAQFRRWQQEIRQTLFISSRLPRLAPKTYGSFSPMPGVIADRVTYRTEFKMRVPAIVYRPAVQAGRLPAMVVVSGHGGDKYSWYDMYTGMLYARAGAVVLTYDPVGEGERNPEKRSGSRLHDRVVDAPQYPERLTGLMITDVMQAVRYLRHRPDIDSSRIAVLGYSLGSFVSVLTGAVDPGIRAVVLSGGGDLDGAGGYWENSGKPMCQAISWKALSVLGDKAAVVYALNQRRGTTFIMNGTRDTVVDIPGHHEQPFFNDLARRTEAITGMHSGVFETYWVQGASHRPNWVTRPAALWLEAQLHFSRWTAQSIDTMPETRIGTWAARWHVPMDKAYESEEREGGVMALGDDIPGIPRADLNVLPDAEWARRRQEFVYGAWVRHALAAAR
ncbi:MAG: alpha/beta hydrolase [Acidobacteriota bacterium]